MNIANMDYVPIIILASMIVIGVLTAQYIDKVYLLGELSDKEQADRISGGYGLALILTTIICIIAIFTN